MDILQNKVELCIYELCYQICTSNTLCKTNKSILKIMCYVVEIIAQLNHWHYKYLSSIFGFFGQILFILFIINTIIGVWKNMTSE